MDPVILHEFYREFLAEALQSCDVEADTTGAAFSEEKIYNIEGEPA